MEDIGQLQLKQHQNDEWVGKSNGEGKFIVKEAYKTISHQYVSKEDERIFSSVCGNLLCHQICLLSCGQSGGVG